LVKKLSFKSIFWKEQETTYKLSPDYGKIDLYQFLFIKSTDFVLLPSKKMIHGF